MFKYFMRWVIEFNLFIFESFIVLEYEYNIYGKGFILIFLMFYIIGDIK